MDLFRGLEGTTTGVIKGDTQTLDYAAYYCNLAQVPSHLASLCLDILRHHHTAVRSDVRPLLRIPATLGL